MLASSPSQPAAGHADSPPPVPQQSIRILSVSIVVYRSDLQVLQRTLDSLFDALQAIHPPVAEARVHLICNDGSASRLGRSLKLSAPDYLTVCIEDAEGNIGYGAAHNLAIVAAQSDVHLILNPDVILASDALQMGLDFLRTHADVTAVSPQVIDGSGQQQFLCKRFPSVLDFLLRGFAPGMVRSRFQRRLAHYEMRDLSPDRPAMDVPIISGCFMLFRTRALQALSGFDPGYFLYFEDFDLSLRAAREGTLAYLPTMKIVHLGGHSARKGMRHILLFVRSAIHFYNTWGWRLW